MIQTLSKMKIVSKKKGISYVNNTVHCKDATLLILFKFLVKSEVTPCGVFYRRSQQIKASSCGIVVFLRMSFSVPPTD